MSPPSPATDTPSPAVDLPPREAEAAKALQSTRFSKGARTVLLAGFLTVSLSSIATTLVTSLQNSGARGTPSLFAPLMELVPNREAFAGISTPADLWRLLPSPAAFHSFEESIEKRASLSIALRPRFQSLLFRATGAGNEQVVPAPGEWLFFRKDLDYINGKSFLEKAVQDAREKAATVAPDSVASIVDFHRQLSSRGIRLLVVPVPVKPCIESHRFHAGQLPDRTPRQNAGYHAWLTSLDENGIAFFDPAPLLSERAASSGEAQFLRTDTHWTPDAMEAVARAVAREIETEPTLPPVRLTELKAAQVTAHGDTVALLGLPRNQSLIQPQTVTIHQVFENKAPWRPALEASVLLLGDSFTNIYSLAAMGWGEHAGFAEHLGAALGRPVDALARNSDGAFATRQMLEKELAAGNDRLRGKTTVVWEFAVRELSFGDWKILPLPEPRLQQRTFLCPPTGGSQKVRGTVSAMAPIPRPGMVPYKEHIVALHLTNVVPEDAAAGGPQSCLVYTWSMREQLPTAAARLRPGDAVSLEIVPWEDVCDKLEKFQRSELNNPALLLEPPTWAAEIR
jgi:hypothetical protein